MQVISRKSQILFMQIRCIYHCEILVDQAQTKIIVLICKENCNICA